MFKSKYSRGKNMLSHKGNIGAIAKSLQGYSPTCLAYLPEILTRDTVPMMPYL